MSERVLPKDDPKLLEHYADLVALFPDAVFVEDEHGTYRFQQRPMVRWLADHVDLNTMWIAFAHNAFWQAEFVRFYQDMGYSLCGFCEVWEQRFKALAPGQEQ